MENKKLTRFKFENLVFIGLVVMYLYGATTRASVPGNPFGPLSNFYTLMMQIGMSYGFKLLLEYIRKNPEEFANSIRELFQDN